jgi:hypothetical protein
LEYELLELLKSLTVEEWHMQSVAKRWKVKDIVSHLLDGNLRGLSMSRDGYFGMKAEGVDSYEDLVNFLNQMNMSWTLVMERLSPQVLISLLEVSGKEYIAHLQTLDLFENAIFSVAWAGQDYSPNWFHIAREYTEKFLHQQQIRDAVGKQGIMTKELFYPFIDTLMFGFPYAFRNVSAGQGAVVSIEISTAIGGIWNIIKMEEGWRLDRTSHLEAQAKVLIDPDTAWKLFSKSWQAEDVMDKVSFFGDFSLGRHVLDIVSVMA